MKTFLMVAFITLLSAASSATAQSVPGEPCVTCGEATPKPKPRAVVCIEFRARGLRGFLWCPGIGLIRNPNYKN